MSNSSNSIIDADFSFQDTPQAPQMALANITNNQTFLATYGEFVDDSNDPVILQKLPRVKIAQKPVIVASQTKFQAGMLINDLFDTETKAMKFVVLGVKKSRIHFHKTFGQKPEWFCRAFDYITGTPNEDDLKPKQLEELTTDTGGEFLCKNCLRKEWNGKEKPLCSETIHLFGYDLETEFPFIMNFSHTALSPFKTLQDKIAVNQMVSIPGGKKVKVKPFLVKISMMTVHKSEASGEWFIPEFFVQNGDLLTKDEAVKASRMQAEYEAMFYMRANEAVEEVVAVDIDAERLEHNEGVLNSTLYADAD